MNKKKVRERTKEHIQDHSTKKCFCECGLVYTHANKARHLRSEDHKRQIEKKDDPNYLLCECGAVVCKNAISGHRKRNRHKKAMEHQPP